MSLKDKEKWNNKYGASDHTVDRQPCEWLSENAHLLAGQGKALDIAMGEGRNAAFAAELGYDVTGIDISEVGVERAKGLAREKNLNLNYKVADFDDYEFGGNEYDLILCFYFLDRRLFPEIKSALKPGGFLLFETFNVGHLKYSSFKREWLLEHNELLKEFLDLHILKYQEVDKDEKACSSLVAQKWNKN